MQDKPRDRTQSMCLDGRKDAKTPDIAHTLPGRRSFSLDVRAGGQDLLLDPVAA